MKISDYIDRYDTGVCLHTGLRKICDSKQTSAMWHILHLFINNYNELWTEYCEGIFNNIKNEEFDNDKEEDWTKIANIVKKITIDDDIYIKKDNNLNKVFNGYFNVSNIFRIVDSFKYKRDVDLNHILFSMSCIFDLFSQDDWKGYVSFFSNFYKK